MYDVIIIGAGVVGCALARKLSQYNGRIAVLEAAEDVSDGASKANSGIVHAGFDAKPGTKKAYYNVKGANMYARLAKELGVPVHDEAWLMEQIANSDSGEGAESADGTTNNEKEKPAAQGNGQLSLF